jgi:hypothetical protein
MVDDRLAYWASWANDQVYTEWGRRQRMDSIATMLELGGLRNISVQRLETGAFIAISDVVGQECNQAVMTVERYGTKEDEKLAIQD